MVELVPALPCPVSGAYRVFVVCRFNSVHKLSPKSVYPMVFWDLMGHAGGSQPHPHYHPFISRHGYYG